MLKYTIIAGLEFTKDGARVQDDVREEALNTARSSLAGLFGGYTETATNGGYVQSGVLVTERGVKFETYSDEGVTGTIYQIAHELALNLSQESVLTSVESTQFAFVKGV